MFLSGSTTNGNIIQPLPRFYTIRFGRRTETDEDEKSPEYKLNKVNRPTIMRANEDNSSLILLTGIRNRDWNFFDDPRDINEKDVPQVKYQLIPSINNTMKNRSTKFGIDYNGSQYFEYDLDEQDFQWLIVYNEYRIENRLPELDENIFEYIMQLLEYQCLVAIREKNYEDTIHCDACHRIDDVDDLIQCVRCKTFVHKKCYGFDKHENEWTCFSCEYDRDVHRCCICELVGGALKPYQSSGDVGETERWIHLSCAFWTPQFEIDEKMTPILRDNLKSDGQCRICNKGTGVKLNCCWKNCQERFHVKCAIDVGQDILIAEDDDETSIHLLALCDRHSEKVDLSEKRIRMNKSLEKKQKRFEQFASYVNLDIIKDQTLILPDVLESIHAYWLLKRQAKHGQPLIDLPEDIFYHDYDKNVNLVEFSRQYHLDHRDEPEDFFDDKSNVLKFLATNRTRSLPILDNLFVKYARRDRKPLMNYERNLFCLLDAEKKKR